MRLKHLFNIAVITFATLFNSTSIAQHFDNYKQDVKNEEILIEMIAITGGSFEMGADKSDTSRPASEKPKHTLEIDDFWIGKYEITWEQYDAFVYGSFESEQFQNETELKKMGIDAVTGATAPYVDMSFGMGKASFPAVNMTQYAAIMYCQWLTSKTGVFYRLPTEAEWEYTCKKGKTDKVNSVKEIAWYESNSEEKYQETGVKKANGLGVYDMLGNVSEWVLDQYSTEYYTNSPSKNPWNKPTELYPRVARGGSWKDTANKLCCTFRQPSKSKWKQRDPQIPKSDWWNTDAPFIGFRVVRPKTQPSKEEIKNYWLEAIEDFGMN